MNPELIKYAANDFKKIFFQAKKQCIFSKNHGKCEKTQKYKVCNNQCKKEEFNVKTKLSYNKRNQKNTDTED